MNETPPGISIPASRFRELRRQFWRAYRGYYQPAWPLMVLGALLFLAINGLLSESPFLAGVFGRNRSYLDLRVFETEDVTAITPEGRSYGPNQDYDYMASGPKVDIVGRLSETLERSVRSGYQELELAIKVDGDIVATRRGYPNILSYEPLLTPSGQEIYQTGQSPLSFSIDLPTLGDHRIEIVLRGLRGSERKDLDRFSVTVRRVQNPPAAPEVLGVLRSMEPNAVLIHGFADPNTSILIERQANRFPALRSDNWGHFVGMIEYPAGMDQVILYSSNLPYFWNLPENEGPAENSQISAGVLLDLAAGPSAAAPTIESNLKILMGYQRLAEEYSFKLDREYPGFPDLLSGKIAAHDYLQVLAGPVVINNRNRDYLFIDAQPDIKLADELAEIRLRGSGYSADDFNYWGDSNFEITFPYGFPLPGNRGSFQIEFAEGERYSIQTKPDAIEGNLYTWKKIAPGQTLSVRILRGDTKTGIRNLANLDIYQVGGPNQVLQDWLRFARQLVQSLPLLAGLWLLYYSRRLSQPSMLVWYARAILYIGIQISYIAIFWEFFSYSIFQNVYSRIMELTYSGFSRGVDYFLGANALNLNYGSAYYQATRIIVLTAFVLLVALAGSIFRARGKRFLASLMLVIAWAVEYSILLLITAVILFAAHVVFLKDVDVNDLSIAAAMIVGGLTIFVVVNNAFHASNLLVHRFAAPARTWKVRLSTLMILALTLLLAYERSSIFSDVSEVDLITNFSYRVQTIINRLESLSLPFTFLFVVLVGIDFGRKAPWKKLNTLTQEAAGRILLPNSWQGWSWFERNHLLLGQIVFAGYIVGVNDIWLLFPISFVTAWLVYRYLLIEHPYKISQLAYVEKKVRTHRTALLAQLAQDLAFLKLQKKKDETLVNLANGKITPSDYEKTVGTLDTEIQALKKSEVETLGMRVKDVVLALGPFEKPIDNAIFGLKRAFLLQFPLLYIFIQYYLFDKIYSNSQHVWLILISQLILFVTRWLVLGFFFGLMYEFIRGNNGLRKALFVSGAYALSILPYRLFTASTTTDFSSYIFEIGQTAIFVICLGLWMDWQTLSAHGYRFSYLKVVVSDIPSLVSVSSILITTISVVVTSLLSGQLTQLFTTALNTVLPAITNLPVPPGP